MSFKVTVGVLGENLESASYPDCQDNKDKHQEKILIRNGTKALSAGPGEVKRGKGWRGRVEWVGLVKLRIKEAKKHSKTCDQCRHVESREGQAGSSTHQSPESAPGAH